MVEAAATKDLSLVTLAPGEVIFRQGEASQAFYLVESGEVRLYKQTHTKYDQHVYVYTHTHTHIYIYIYVYLHMHIHR